jgi:hypothetical protein
MFPILLSYDQGDVYKEIHIFDYTITFESSILDIYIYISM